MTRAEVIARAFTLLCFVQAALSVFMAVATNLGFLTYL